jgi:hypothetical protein
MTTDQFIKESEEEFKKLLEEWKYFESIYDNDMAAAGIKEPQSPVDYLSQKLQEMAEVAREEGIKELDREINNNCLISELYGWKGIVDMSVDRLLNKPKE